MTYTKLVNPELEMLLRLLAAMVLCGLIGFEREARGKSAGLRTHMLVGFASAMFVILGEIVMARESTKGYAALKLDPIAIIGATISGISFLGAGTIFMSPTGRKHGLTTAASILGSASIGMACGLEHYVLAVGGTVLLIMILSFFGYLEREIIKDSNPKNHSDEL
jgi:putative Mg2+ transporter-C (MgtC) family protein